MPILDISPPIRETLAVWPGDTPPSREVLLDLDRGDGVTLSTLRATVHLGAHADAPSHYGRDSPTIEARELSFYIGACQVAHVLVERCGLVRPEHVQDPPAHVDHLLVARHHRVGPRQERGGQPR